MRLNEIETNVQVTDGDKHYYYWVTQSRPEIAKRAALRKHRDRMGIGMRVRGQDIADKELTATIMPDDRKARTLDFHSDDKSPDVS